MTDLERYRDEIDEIDSEIVRLFEKRMKDRRRTDKGYATCYGSGQEKYGNSALTRKNSCAG